MYHEINCKVFRQVNSHLKVPSDTRAMLIFHCCIYTKINVSAVFLPPPLFLLVIACNQLFKLGNGLFLVWSYKEIELVESCCVLGAPIKVWFHSSLDIKNPAIKHEEAGKR